jgi:hypothetical protein
MTRPQLSIEVTLKRSGKSATAMLREGKALVSIPQSWPKAYQKKVSETLSQSIIHRFETCWDLVQTESQQTDSLFTMTDPQELSQWVQKINAESFQVPLKGIRLGKAKHSRMAQMNTRTAVMTVSCFALEDVPYEAARYLVIHELAHLIEANHSSRFWALVQQFVSDYRQQRKIIAAFHHIRCYQADSKTQDRVIKAQNAPKEVTDLPKSLHQLVLPL